MNIIYFHQYFSTPQGAAGTRSYEMARRLLYHGHQVTMICGSAISGKTGLGHAFVNGRREGYVDGIYVIEFDLPYANNDTFFQRSKAFVQFVVRSVSLVFTRKYDVVFATSTPLTAGLPGVLAKWLCRKPFVFEVRDLWPELPKAMGVIKNPLVIKSLSLLEWVIYHSADRCIGLSPGIAEGIVKRGVAKSAVITIPNGCDLSIFTNVKQVDLWRPEGVAKTDFVVVFAGAHGFANGLENILNAAAVLKNRNRCEIKIVLIGQGKYKKELQERAQEEQLNNIIFHDSVSKLKLAGLLSSADVGLQVLSNIPAFYYGTSPNKFFDYIAAGLPVLNNYPGWLADIITEKECGFVVPPEDPFAFADALERASKMSAEQLKKMGESALELAKSKFERGLLADQWVDWVVAGNKKAVE